MSNIYVTSVSYIGKRRNMEISREKCDKKLTKPLLGLHIS